MPVRRLTAPDVADFARKERPGATSGIVLVPAWRSRGPRCMVFLVVWAAAVLLAGGWCMAGQDEEPRARGRSATEWMRILRSGLDPESEAAAEALWSLREEASVALAALGEAARSDPSPVVRMTCLRAAAEQWVPDATREAVVVAAARDPDSIIRAEAALLLGRLGPASATVETLIRGLLKDGYANVRGGALLGVKALGVRAFRDDVSPLLGDPAPLVRFIALDVLDADDLMTGSLGEKVRALLEDPDVRVQAQAAAVLCKAGPCSPDTSSAMGAVLQSERPDDRVLGLVILRNLGSRGSVLRAEVARLCGDPDAGVRASAIRTLSVVGGAPGVVCDSLVKGVTDPDTYVRVASYEIASELRKSCQIPRALCSRGLADDRAIVRVACARYLLLEEPSLEAIERVLLDCMRDPEPSTREAAILVIGDNLVNLPQAKEGLLRLAVEDPEPQVRRTARGVLASHR